MILVLHIIFPQCFQKLRAGDSKGADNSALETPPTEFTSTFAIDFIGRLPHARGTLYQ